MRLTVKTATATLQVGGEVGIATMGPIHSGVADGRGRVEIMAWQATTQLLRGPLETEAQHHHATR